MMRKIWALALVWALAILLNCAALAENETYEFEGKIYSAVDVERLRGYLNEGDRGQMVNPNYTADNPATYGVVWEESDGMLRAVSLEWQDMQMSGELSFAGMDHLRSVTLSRNQLTGLNLSGCYQLAHLYCDENQLSYLDLSGCASLQELFADDNLLSDIELSDCVSLEALFINANMLETLALSDLPALKLVQCESNLLTRLTVRNCPALEGLYCQKNNLPFLNVSGCTQLKTLCAQENLLLAVNLTDCLQLSTLKLAGNRLTALPDLTNYTGLTVETTDVSGNGFEEDDLAMLPEALKGSEDWVLLQTSTATGISLSNPEPVSEQPPEYDLANLGDVVTNRQGTVFAYEASVARENEGWALVVTVQPSNDGKYYQRNLSLRRDTLIALQEAGFFEAALRMDDVWIYVPIVEMLEALGDKGMHIVMMLAPMEEKEWSEEERQALSGQDLRSGTYRYRVTCVAGGEAVNITGNIDALRVRVMTEEAGESEKMRIYVVSNQEGNQGDMTYYVPNVGEQGVSSLFSADVSGAGSGLIGLLQAAN